MNGHTVTEANGNGFKKIPISFLHRVFNIASSQWSRVTECWFITLFFKIGSAIGWTILTAGFVSRFGIAFLPTLFILNAVLIMVSTFFFEQLIMRMKREVLMIIMLLLAATLLFFASFFYEQQPVVFFTLIIFAEAVFLAQFNVFIPILVGDRFTPLESQRTFPFIESAETIGAMVGGILVGLFAQRVPVVWFLYLWIIVLACTIFVFIITSYVRVSLPPLPFRVKTPSQEKPQDEIKKVFASIKQMPFLKGIVMVVLLQWIFMNLLEFQYTKALEQRITNKTEPTIAYEDTKLFQAAILSSPEGIKNLPKINPSKMKRALSVSEQNQLTEKLGTLKGIFHGAAFLVQILFASRIITALGVIGSLFIHPVLMLMSLVGMFLKFGFWSSVSARTTFEVTNVVHKNAYFASHYAFPKSIRDQAAEFLEGMVRPMGTIVGMVGIIALQLFFKDRELSLWIHGVMFFIMATLFVVTIRLQPLYTNISRDQLFSNLPYPEKLNAIEILSQRGHRDAPVILIEKLNLSSSQNSGSAGVTESPQVRIKILSALGQFRDYQSLPDILEALYDPDSEVRLEAAHALMNFSDIGEKFYTQAFSRFRMIETLKDVFRKEKSTAVRSAIIRIFSLLHQSNIVVFLLELLKESSPLVRAESISTLGLFRDPNAAYYILPFVTDPHPSVRANALIALWQFPKYRPMLSEQLREMLENSDPQVIQSALFVLGEINFKDHEKLFTSLHGGDPSLQLEAAFALTKAANPRGFLILLERFLSLQEEDFDRLRRFSNYLRPPAKAMVERMLVHVISERLNRLMHDYPQRDLLEIPLQELLTLKRLYQLLDQHEELYVIETALQRISPSLL